MYHRVKDGDPDCLSTPISVFEETLLVLKDKYKVVPLSSLVDSISQKRNIEPRTVVITFDDGYQDNIL